VAANKLGARTGDVFFVTDSLYTKTETDSNFVRLSSNVTYERKNDLQWLVVGDQFASSGDLGSIINIGGVGFSKVYKIDPYLITEQMFSLRGVTAYPSQAQVYMDGVLVSKNAVAPGSFDLKNIYSYGGAHTVDVILTDPFGKEEKISYPMYFSPQLLREGLHEYSYNAGFLREQYGVKSNEYGKAAFSAFHRYGITSSMNIGARAEGMSGIYNGGLFAMFTLPKAGSFSFSFAGSSTNSEKGSAGIFQQSYQLGSFNTNLDVRIFSRGYATVGVQASDDRTKLQKSFSVGIPVSHLGGISLTASEVETYNGIDIRTASVSYSQSITRNTSMFATVSTSHIQDTTYGFFIGLNFTSANNIHGAVQYNNTGGVNTETVQIQKDTPRGAGVGYQATLVRSDAGASTSYTANPSFTYNAPYGVYSLGAGIQDASGSTSESVNIGVAGAFVYAGGFYGFARPVNDSFAIVLVGNVPNVTVQTDGLESGKTGSSGTMVVPELVSYNNNKITLDTKNMPMDYSISEVNAAIAPSLWSGSCVAFDAIKVRAVTGTVYGMNAEKKIPLEYVDLLIKVGDREVTSPTGKNGEFYIENTLPKNPDTGTYDKLSCRAIAERRKAGSSVIQPGTYRASVAYEGGKCEFSITFPATDDVITDLGELRCVFP
jgi:outer membrane usher protein